MFESAIKRYITKMLSSVDVTIDGTKPWDMRVLDERLYSRLLRQGSLGLGEAYMDGWFDTDKLDELLYRLVQLYKHPLPNVIIRLLFGSLMDLTFNQQNKKRSLQSIKQHYDLSNELFEKMLDKRMTYSCAYWKEAKNLDQAQEAKLDLVCRKLQIQPGMTVLDIGCGWGSFAKYAAEKYGAVVTGITISKEQLELAQQRCQGLPITLRFQDYRDLKESFDRVVSIGQMEHVGYKNYKTFMQVVSKALNKNGMFLLHTIGSNLSVYRGEPWMEKYIFPYGMLPSIAQIAKASEGLLVMEDWHNFSTYYDQTLMAWFDNFNAHWDELKKDYDERFYRMWKYYLLGCAAGFRARYLQLWQVVFSKEGVIGGYESIR